MTTDMKISEVDAMCERVAKVKAEIKELEAQIDAKADSIKALEPAILEMFLASGRRNFQSPHGTLYMHDDLSITVPKTKEDKEAYLGFLEDTYGEERFWAAISFNSNSLKADYKAHLAAVEERGGDPLVEVIPGITPPTPYTQLRFKGKR